MEGICHCQYQQRGWSAPWSVLSSEEEIEYVYVTDKERAREKLLHRKIILILAICVCVYSNCCSTNSRGNKNKNCHSIYSLIYFSEHLGREPVRASMLAWRKRNVVLIPRYPLLHTVKFCQLISNSLGDPKETVISETLMLRGLGSAKHPEFQGLIWAYQQ